MIENSIDAGASAISIEIREGGISLIRVNDNGSGMARADAELAVERFATSKIESSDDLFRIHTLGFRGEALPSIASVAQLELLTRSRDALEGTRLQLAEGRKQAEVAGAPVGTQVTVRHLFYNAPARRKFLKAPLREGELIQKTAMQYALAFPQVAFRLVVDGRESLVAPAGSPLERIAVVWGREIAEEMLEINYTSVDLGVRGHVSRPTLARASREWQVFNVNGRPIRSGLLAVTVERPYAGRLPPNRHPLAVIRIDVDPQMIDVNVHPRKAEVRFFQERAIYGAVAQAIEEALRDFPPSGQPAAFDWPFANVPAGPGGEAWRPGEPRLAGEPWPAAESDSAAGVAAHEAHLHYAASLSGWRAVAQVHNTYIVAQTPEGMVIVDQHAAQEQVFYEELTSGHTLESDPVRPPHERLPGAAADSGLPPGTAGASGSQRSQVQLLPREAELVNAHLEEYRSLGIGIEPFGENAFRVHAVPLFVTMPPAELFAVLLQEHERFRTLEGQALRDKLAAKMACVSAIKAGDALSPEEQQALLEDLMQAYAPATCPHGRPVFIRLSLEELERRFLRR